MEEITLEQLQQRPALFWCDTNNCFRITYPDGYSEIPDSDANFVRSMFTLKAFIGKQAKQFHFYFIQWL